MSDEKTVYMTEEGLEELKEELHRLRTEERSRIADEIAEARAKGDLSENAEYDAAKEEQGKLEARIAEIEDTIARARVVDESTVDDSKAYILSKVTVENKDTGAEQTYTLVSEQEADVSNRSGPPFSLWRLLPPDPAPTGGRPLRGRPGQRLPVRSARGQSPSSWRPSQRTSASAWRRSPCTRSSFRP